MTSQSMRQTLDYDVSKHVDVFLSYFHFPSENIFLNERVLFLHTYWYTLSNEITLPSRNITVKLETNNGNK